MLRLVYLFTNYKDNQSNTVGKVFFIIIIKFKTKISKKQIII